MSESQKVMCKCSECVAKEGPNGKLVAYSTFTRHRRNDTARTAQAAFATAERLSATQMPMSSAATGTSTVPPPGHDRRHQRSTDLDVNPEPLKQLRDAETDTSGLTTLQDNFDMMDVGPSNLEEFVGPETDSAGGVYGNPSQDDISRSNVDNQRTILDDAEFPPPLDDRYNSSEEEEEDPPTLTRPSARPPVPPRVADPNMEYDTEMPDFEPIIDDINTSDKFITALKTASLNSIVEPLDADLISALMDPRTEIPELSSDERLSIEIFLAVGNASQETYTNAMKAIRKSFPQCKPLTFFLVQKLVKTLSGVFPITRDMCVKTCVGFTGPFSALEQCPICGEERFITVNRKKVPQQQFTTIPIGPQLQCLRYTESSSKNMNYRKTFTETVLRQAAGHQTPDYQDFFNGEDYLTAFQQSIGEGVNRQKRIKDQDVCLILSMDGAQLYRNKISECWLYIWILLDLPPDLRYKKKHVLPGGFIPGPNKPKNVDSFLFPGLYHLAALQRHGLKIWDSMKREVLTSHPFLSLVTADGPAMACICGFVGHQGKIHCRLHCSITGRHKQGNSTYYPVMLKPNNFTVQGCDHPDVNLSQLLGLHTQMQSSQRYETNIDFLKHSANPTDYKRRRLQTGLVKPTIFSGLPEKRTLGIPGIFALDIMHLPCLNIPDLLIDLWRGDKKLRDHRDTARWDWAVLESEEEWRAHGKMVEDARPYIPASFDRRPRNPAEKINSGYKAWEFLLYIYGLGPCLFHGLLPERYWMHYCKLVRGYRLMLQETIRPSEVREAHLLLTQFATEFEELYYQRQQTRLQFVRPNIHTSAHVPGETIRLGPLIIFAQWTIERTIGNLVEEIRNHASPYANISQRGIRRCQVNALKALIPGLDKDETTVPQGSIDVGNSYLLSGADTAMRGVTPAEKSAIVQYGIHHGDPMETFNRTGKVRRWAKARLPNGQKVRSEWKEEMLRMASIRSSKNIKYLNQQQQLKYGRTRHFVWYPIKGSEQAFAVVSQYGPPDQDMLTKSLHTYWTSQYLGEMAIEIVPVHSILAVVMMAPDLQFKRVFAHRAQEDRWYLMEKPGLKLHRLIGLVEEDDDEVDLGGRQQ